MMKSKKWSLAKRVVALVAAAMCIAGSIACQAASESGSAARVQVAQAAKPSIAT
jgi:hypothetical protein